MVTFFWNDNWKFLKSSWQDINVSCPVTGDVITLPHTWYKDDDYYRGEAAYQKQFVYTKKENERVFAKFHGVDKVCKLYLNGTQIGEHEGGYNIFTVELTDALVAGENILTVLVSTDKDLMVSPISGDFAVFGGIHRDVEFISTEEICFDRTYYGTDGVVFNTMVDADGNGELWSQTVISGEVTAKDVIDIVYTILDEKHQIATNTLKPEEGMNKVLSVENPVLWNGLYSTHLYTARACLIKNGKIIDTVEKQIGFRTIGMDADKGFFLNWEHVKLHGVAKHQDTYDVFSAATMKNWKEDMELIQEIGANAVRLSHYPHPQQVYDLCDEMGFITWAEIPLLKLTEDEELFENAKYQLKEMILQNMHHPSICFWGIQNEIAIYGEFPYMAEKLQELNELTHSLDDSRFSTCANLNVVHPESSLNQITDVTAYNIYYGWYYGQFADHGKFLDDFHKTNPNMPLGISEYGADTNIAYHSDEPKVNDYSEEFQALYHETVYPMMAERDFVWGSFVWNMFDFTSPIRQAANIKNRNIKGLVTFDRKTRKDSFYYYKAVWSKEPFVHIGSKRYVNRNQAAITVKVYSNQPEVTITINENEYTSKVNNGSAIFTNVPLNMGANEIKATAGGVTDQTIFNRQEEPDESYVYVDQNPGLNVRNWFLDEQSEKELFPEGYLSIRCTINDLLASKEASAAIKRRMPDVAEGLKDMVGTFTLEKFFKYTKPDYTDEEMKALNAELTKIAI